MVVRPSESTSPLPEVGVPGGEAPRSPTSIGLEMAERGLILGLEFVVPMLLGLGFDRWRGTLPWGTLIGTALGFVVGLWHLIRFARQAEARDS
jgi:F0F1-type ATP synthase assembly protein I